LEGIPPISGKKILPLLTSPTPQNTEDEVLKAAIAKYGKNQW
jgi:hypothetical protein